MAFATNEVHAGSNPAGRSSFLLAVPIEGSLASFGISPAGSDVRITAQVRVLPGAPQVEPQFLKRSDGELT
jgi:hypothetical protein